MDAQAEYSRTMVDVDAVRNFPRLARRGELRKFVEARAAWNGVTPYAYMLHMLACCKWSAKGVASVVGGSVAAIYSTLQHFGVCVTSGHSGAMAVLATREGCHDAVAFGIAMIRKYGNHKRAARALGITPIQFYAPFLARELSFDSVLRLRFDGDISLYSVRSACAMFGANYQYMQQSYYAAKEEGSEYESFQHYAAERFKRMGKHANVQSVLGWPRDVVDTLIADGLKESKDRAKRVEVQRTANKAAWKRSGSEI